MTIVPIEIEGRGILGVRTFYAHDKYLFGMRSGIYFHHISSHLNPSSFIDDASLPCRLLSYFFLPSLVLLLSFHFFPSFLHNFKSVPCFFLFSTPIKSSLSLVFQFLPPLFITTPPLSFPLLSSLSSFLTVKKPVDFYYDHFGILKHKMILPTYVCMYVRTFVRA